MTEDVTLDEGQSFEIAEGQEVNFQLDAEVACTKEAFKVNNGILNLSGEGTIKTNTTNPNSAIAVIGSNAVLNIDGVTIDTSAAGSTENYAYGVYLRDNASINFNSGTIKVEQGCCISSNNLTGGSTAINVNGGELLSNGCYAIYSPAQEEINITGGTIQGINARIGKIKISGDAKIIPTAINAENCVTIGQSVSTSGCLELGDTIALVAGTYDDDDGTNTILEISKDVTVESNFRSAIAIYSVDTKISQNVLVNVRSLDNISTTDEGFDAIKVYDHEAISESAQEAGKPYDPQYNSEIIVLVNNRPYSA